MSNHPNPKGDFLTQQRRIANQNAQKAVAHLLHTSETGGKYGFECLPTQDAEYWAVRFVAECVDINGNRTHRAVWGSIGAGGVVNYFDLDTRNSRLKIDRAMRNNRPRKDGKRRHEKWLPMALVDGSFSREAKAYYVELVHNFLKACTTSGLKPLVRLDEALQVQGSGVKIATGDVSDLAVLS